MPRRIDVHHHVFPKTLSKSAQSESVGFKTPEENLPWSPELSLKAMDSLGVDVAILSLPAGLPPGPSGPENRKAAREFNIMAAQICKEYPERFGFFASLPIPSDAQAAVVELTYALDVLRADGVALASSYGEGAAATYIGDDSYDAVWEELDRRGTVVFLHGTQTPSSTPYPHPFLGIPITEVPNETFKAAAHLVVTVGAERDFSSFYFDTALGAHETTLSAVESFAMPGHVLFGTDFPAVSVDVAKYYTENVEKYYKDRPTELQETAAKLFNKIDTRDEQW